MRKTTVTVSTDFEQVKTFVQFAKKYAGDYGRPELDWVTELSLPDLWREIQKRYSLEQGERIIRPLYYWDENLRKISGAQDCDDATIQFVSRFLWARIEPSDILILEAREPHQDYYCHIFAGLHLPNGEIIFLDNLPHSRYNRLDYAPSLVRVTTAADYL